MPMFSQQNYNIISAILIRMLHTNRLSFLFANRARVLSLTTSSFVHRANRLLPRMTNYVTYLSHYSEAPLSQVQSFSV